ncbi:transcription factor family protein, putative [Ichthyophthirius multifiliis]|uniref:Transcription factor family protein, putative n=1 Tax=Ichthyophthirius multifiliis TaxID=5932 RepID=G0QL29_ICHMU|nr:transcription factor family protein, putative [Ichthyophthirius multifiliis]EGR34085.1 transcription factor family protein, putative [Ichthyophthirius multifiliis]|eukprot:XP_004039389.1 transcription factor family protein, putative [Ichthyophthirius multifiliis]
MKIQDTINRINKEYIRISRNQIENILAVPNPKNIFQWHFCIHGLKNCAFVGGYYHGILNLPPEYPLKPPTIKLITPNGRFAEGQNICTNFTSFHTEQWESSWNIEKMLIAIVSFMNDNEMSTGVVVTSEYEKNRLAKQSLIWNLKNNIDFKKYFKSFYKILNVPSNVFTFDEQQLNQYEKQVLGIQYYQGTCSKCEVSQQSTCYCGKKNQETLCGEENFSCNDVCGKSLDCGNHKCQQKCHKGLCTPCQLLPEDVDTCPCGQSSLLILAGGNFREKCTDPIPTCTSICNKPLSCNIHKCQNKCHEGECVKCEEYIEEICRCKQSKREIECFKLTLNKTLGKQYICDRICKKTKSCNVHKCNTPCCPVNKSNNDLQGIHLCLKVCEKKLSCGKHTCELFCHLGLCGKCPIKINEPISCICGKATLKPPQPCGTEPPECHFPCSREKPCGHPCHLNCHIDQCPPCEFKVEKKCRCGAAIVPNVSCSKEALCTIACGKPLSCGHKCEEVCHLGQCPKEGNCQKKCNKQRLFCGHKCIQTCHGQSECPKEPCKVEIVIKCKCGHREAFVECGTSDCVLDRSLACNDVCRNINRFARFYDNEKVFYPAVLVRFAKQNMLYLIKLEKKIESFIKNQEKELSLPFQNDTQKKVSVQNLLARHYHLNVQYYNHFNSPYFVIESTKDVCIPKCPLSEYCKKVEKGEIKSDVSPFQVSIRFIGVLAKNDPNFEQLDYILKDVQKEFYVEKEDRSIVVHFWDKQVAEVAQKKLYKSQSMYSNFSFEVNEKLLKEEQQLIVPPSDIIRRMKVQKQQQQQNDQGEDQINNQEFYIIDDDKDQKYENYYTRC